MEKKLTYTSIFDNSYDYYAFVYSVWIYSVYIYSGLIMSVYVDSYF